MGAHEHHGQSRRDLFKLAGVGVLGAAAGAAATLGTATPSEAVASTPAAAASRGVTTLWKQTPTPITGPGQTAAIAVPASIKNLTLGVNVTASSPNTTGVALTVDYFGPDGVWYPVIAVRGIFPGGVAIGSAGPGSPNGVALTDTVRVRWELTSSATSATFGGFLTGR